MQMKKHYGEIEDETNRTPRIDIIMRVFNLAESRIGLRVYVNPMLLAEQRWLISQQETKGEGWRVKEGPGPTGETENQTASDSTGIKSPTRHGDGSIRALTSHSPASPTRAPTRMRGVRPGMSGRDISSQVPPTTNETLPPIRPKPSQRQQPSERPGRPVTPEPGRGEWAPERECRRPRYEGDHETGSPGGRSEQDYRVRETAPSPESPPPCLELFSRKILFVKEGKIELPTESDDDGKYDDQYADSVAESIMLTWPLDDWKFK